MPAASSSSESAVDGYDQVPPGHQRASPAAIEGDRPAWAKPHQPVKEGFRDHPPTAHGLEEEAKASDHDRTPDALEQAFEFAQVEDLDGCDGSPDLFDSTTQLRAIEHIQQGSFARGDQDLPIGPVKGLDAVERGSGVCGARPHGDKARSFVAERPDLRPSAEVEPLMRALGVAVQLEGGVERQDGVRGDPPPQGVRIDRSRLRDVRGVDVNVEALAQLPDVGSLNFQSAEELTYD